MSSLIQVSEIFGPTVQGEGSLIGQPTLFVRTGGCDYRCSWCDTLYAVLPEFSLDWHKKTAQEIMTDVEHLSQNKIKMITLSGGNPALQPLEDLLDLGHERGYRFAMETQGSVAKDWFSKLDILTLSPKGPSSGMITKTEQVSACLKAFGKPRDATLKIVIFSQEDYAYAQAMAHDFDQIRMVLQVGNPQVDPQKPADLEGLLEQQRKLSAQVIEDGWDHVSVLPQMHVLLWGNKAGV